jgi:hypothetical protein
LFVCKLTASGWLLVIIPYDRDNAQNYYTVELRTQKNFDRGIKQVNRGKPKSIFGHYKIGLKIIHSKILVSSSSA